MKCDTSRIGYNTFEKGESSTTMSDMHEGKTAPKAKKPTGKKSYKPIFFNCHKPGHIANVCKSRSNGNTGYIPNTRYMPRRFEFYCYTCNMYGHRQVNADMKQKILHLT